MMTRFKETLIFKAGLLVTVLRFASPTKTDDGSLWCNDKVFQKYVECTIAGMKRSYNFKNTPDSALEDMRMSLLAASEAMNMKGSMKENAMKGAMLFEIAALIDPDANSDRKITEIKNICGRCYYYVKKIPDKDYLDAVEKTLKIIISEKKIKSSSQQSEDQQQSDDTSQSGEDDFYQFQYDNAPQQTGDASNTNADIFYKNQNNNQGYRASPAKKQPEYSDPYSTYETGLQNTQKNQAFYNTQYSTQRNQNAYPNNYQQYPMNNAQSPNYQGPFNWNYQQSNQPDMQNSGYPLQNQNLNSYNRQYSKNKYSEIESDNTDANAAAVAYAYNGPQNNNGGRYSNGDSIEPTQEFSPYQNNYAFNSNKPASPASATSSFTNDDGDDSDILQKAKSDEQSNTNQQNEPIAKNDKVMNAIIFSEHMFMELHSGEAPFNKLFNTLTTKEQALFLIPSMCYNGLIACGYSKEIAQKITRKIIPMIYKLSKGLSAQSYAEEICKAIMEGLFSNEMIGDTPDIQAKYLGQAMRKYLEGIPSTLQDSNNNQSVLSTIQQDDNDDKLSPGSFKDKNSNEGGQSTTDIVKDTGSNNYNNDSYNDDLNTGDDDYDDDYYYYDGDYDEDGGDDNFDDDDDDDGNYDNAGDNSDDDKGNDDLNDDGGGDDNDDDDDGINPYEYYNFKNMKYKDKKANKDTKYFDDAPIFYDGDNSNSKAKQKPQQQIQVEKNLKPQYDPNYDNSYIDYDDNADDYSDFYDNQNNKDKFDNNDDGSIGPYRYFKSKKLRDRYKKTNKNAESVDDAPIFYDNENSNSKGKQKPQKQKQDEKKLKPQYDTKYDNSYIDYDDDAVDDNQDDKNNFNKFDDNGDDAISPNRYLKSKKLRDRYKKKNKNTKFVDDAPIFYGDDNSKEKQKLWEQRQDGNKLKPQYDPKYDNNDNENLDDLLSVSQGNSDEQTDLSKDASGIQPGGQNPKKEINKNVGNDGESRERIKILMQKILDCMQDGNFNYQLLGKSIAALAKIVDKEHPDWGAQKSLIRVLIEVIVAMAETMKKTNFKDSSGINQQPMQVPVPAQSPSNFPEQDGEQNYQNAPQDNMNRNYGTEETNDYPESIVPQEPAYQPALDYLVPGNQEIQENGQKNDYEIGQNSPSMQQAPESLAEPVFTSPGTQMTLSSIPQNKAQNSNWNFGNSAFQNNPNAFLPISNNNANSQFAMQPTFQEQPNSNQGYQLNLGSLPQIDTNNPISMQHGYQGIPQYLNEQNNVNFPNSAQMGSQGNRAPLTQNDQGNFNNLRQAQMQGNMMPSMQSSQNNLNLGQSGNWPPSQQGSWNNLYMENRNQGINPANQGTGGMIPNENMPPKNNYQLNPQIWG